MIATISIKCDKGFSDEDVRELYAAVRRIERQRPKDFFLILSDPKDDSSTVEEALQKLQDVYPIVEDVPVDVWVMKKEDQ